MISVLGIEINSKEFNNFVSHIKTNFRLDGCWEFQGYALPDGYRRFHIARLGVSLYAHRLSLGLALRERGIDVPKAMLVLHSCSNPCCVNPRHLRIGTHKDNMADATSAGAYRRGYEKRINRYGGSRMTKEIAQKVIEMRDGGKSIAIISNETGIRHLTVARVLKGRVK